MNHAHLKNQIGGNTKNTGTRQPSRVVVSVFEGFIDGVFVIVVNRYGSMVHQTVRQIEIAIGIDPTTRDHVNDVYQPDDKEECTSAGQDSILDII